MRRRRILLFSLILITLNKSVDAALPLPSDKDISILISLNPNSLVSLTKNQNGQYTGNLMLSVKEISHRKTYTISRPISADTVATLIQKHLDLGLLKIQGSDLKAIDGFRSSFIIRRANEERNISLVAGLPNENSSRAGNVVRFLSSELNVQSALYAFLNTVPSGIYQIGMRSVKVHEIISVGDKKSSLYQSFEKSIKNNRIDVPLYIINGKIVAPVELNKYELADVIKVEVKKGAEASVYGAAGANGVVILSIKVR